MPAVVAAQSVVDRLSELVELVAVELDRVTIGTVKSRAHKAAI
jgi:hypothetical protein